MKIPKLFKKAAAFVMAAVTALWDVPCVHIHQSNFL